MTLEFQAFHLTFKEKKERKMTQEQILFLVLAFVASISALGVVFSAYPVRSALFLVLNLFTLALIYFTLQTPFIGAVQVIVYVGAIMVLFLFAVMLLNPGVPEKTTLKDPKIYLAFLGSVVFLWVILSQIIVPFSRVLQARAPANFGSPVAIGKVLFTQYVWPFELVSLLLLAGVVGAILLAKRRL